METIISHKFIYWFSRFVIMSQWYIVFDKLHINFQPKQEVPGSANFRYPSFFFFFWFCSFSLTSGSVACFATVILYKGQHLKRRKERQAMVDQTTSAKLPPCLHRRHIPHGTWRMSDRPSRNGKSTGRESFGGVQGQHFSILITLFIPVDLNGGPSRNQRLTQLGNPAGIAATGGAHLHVPKHIHRGWYNPSTRERIVYIQRVMEQTMVRSLWGWLARQMCYSAHQSPWRWYRLRVPAKHLFDLPGCNSPDLHQVALYSTTPIGKL